MTATPIEPSVILRGNDPTAYLLVVVWACLQERLGKLTEDQAEIASLQASAMEEWARVHGQDMSRAFAAWMELVNEVYAGLVQLIPPGGVRH